MARILRKLVIGEVSAVDKPACLHCKALLIKRDAPRDETGDAGENYRRNGVIDFKKMMPTEDSVALQKLIDDGELNLSKSEIHEVLERRAEQLREDGETLQQSYVKFITADPAGRVLFKAYQSAQIGKAKAPEDAVQDDAPRHDGPASAKFHSMVVDHQRANRGLSYQQSYSRLYSDPDNFELREQIKAEHLAATRRTLTIGEAQNLEPARPFPR
jgi:hypothetical protein